MFEIVMLLAFLGAGLCSLLPSPGKGASPRGRSRRKPLPTGSRSPKMERPLRPGPAHGADQDRRRRPEHERALQVA